MGQVLSTGIVTSYYASLLALTIRYFVTSFNSPLPWSKCKPEWGSGCIDSSPKEGILTNTSLSTSAELFF